MIREPLFYGSPAPCKPGFSTNHMNMRHHLSTLLFLLLPIAGANSSGTKEIPELRQIGKIPAISVHLLAAVIWGEARGEGLDGMKLVGEVAINRLHDQNFPNRLDSVLLQKNQFAKPLYSYPVEVYTLAKEVIESKPEHGYLFFCNPITATNKEMIHKAYRIGKRYGRHWFF